MNRKLFYIVSSYFVYLMVLSCNDMESAGCTIVDVYHNYINVESTTMVQDNPPTNKYTLKEIDKGEVALDDHMRLAYALDFEDSLSLYDVICQLDDFNLKPFQANALSPIYEENHYIDSFESISITTMNDFDGRHYANSNIHEYFKFGSTSKFRGKFQSIDSIASFLHAYSDHDKRDIPLLLVLERNPTLNQEVEFRIIFKFISGKEISVVTSPVTIKN